MDDSVAIVRSAFDAAAAGNIDGLMQAYSPDVQFLGYDPKGAPRFCRDRNEFFGMVMELMSYTDEWANELVRAIPVGDSLVMAHVRAHRRARATGLSVDDDFVMALRIDDSQITHGVELAGPAILEFWARTSAG